MMRGLLFFALAAWLSGAVAAKPAKHAPTGGGSGTTIVGEQQSPIGLYITPWRDAAPKAGIDKPARLLHQGAQPVDPLVFARRVEYYRALTEHLEQQGHKAP